MSVIVRKKCDECGKLSEHEIIFDEQDNFDKKECTNCGNVSDFNGV